VSYSVTLLRDVQKALGRMDDALHARVVRALRQLEADPRHTGTVKLTGPEDLYRIRVGDWRIVYVIRDRELVVMVVRIAHRREVYR
jgi:mRNA interferase RelE/StbE